MPIPVLPRITAPPIHPPLGVASNMFPALSIIAMCVVSLRVPRIGSAFGAGPADFVPSGMLATQYFHSLTFESNGSGLPAIRFHSIRKSRNGSIGLPTFPTEQSPQAPLQTQNRFEELSKIRRTLRLSTTPETCSTRRRVADGLAAP